MKVATYLVFLHIFTKFRKKKILIWSIVMCKISYTYIVLLRIGRRHIILIEYGRQQAGEVVCATTTNNFQMWRLFVKAPLRHYHLRLLCRQQPTVFFIPRNLTVHLFDTLHCHVGAGSWSSSFAKDHYHKRNPGREMHGRIGKRKVVLVLSFAVVLSANTKTKRNLRLFVIFSVAKVKVSCCKKMKPLTPWRLGHDWGRIRRWGLHSFCHTTAICPPFQH